MHGRFLIPMAMNKVKNEENIIQENFNLLKFLSGRVHSINNICF